MEVGTRWSCHLRASGEKKRTGESVEDKGRACAERQEKGRASRDERERPLLSLRKNCVVSVNADGIPI